MSEVWKNLLGSGALTVVLVVLIQTALKIHENRTTVKEAREKGLTVSDRARDERDAEWNARYRKAAEAHIRYDVEVARRVYILEREVNELMEAAGRPTQVFTPLPDPPPLFPDPITPGGTK